MTGCSGWNRWLLVTKVYVYNLPPPLSPGEVVKICTPLKKKAIFWGRAHQSFKSNSCFNFCSHLQQCFGYACKKLVCVKGFRGLISQELNQWALIRMLLTTHALTLATFQASCDTALLQKSCKWDLVFCRRLASIVILCYTTNPLLNSSWHTGSLKETSVFQNRCGRPK